MMLVRLIVLGLMMLIIKYWMMIKSILSLNNKLKYYLVIKFKVQMKNKKKFTKVIILTKSKIY